MEYIKKIYGHGKPIIGIIGCLHGDETIGKRVVDEIAGLNIKKGSVVTLIANYLAYQRKKRFIKQDLNRAFPGLKNGNYEQKLAYKIINIVKNVDYLIDIHSTTTDVKNTVIITKKNKKILKLINFFKPRRVVLMKKNISDKSLINFCQCGISFEYGKDKNKFVFKNVLRDIMIILARLKMIEKKIIQKNKKIDYYKITGAVVKKKNYVLIKKIKNFKLIKKGESYASFKENKLLSKENFYPILFGKKSYKEIYGFKGIKIN